MRAHEFLFENQEPVVDLESTVGDKTFVPPNRTIIGYKLFRVNRKKPGKLFPLFVLADDPVEIGEWYVAREGQPVIDPKTGTSGVKSKLGKLAYRPGWHGGDYPVAKHIGDKRRRNPVTGKLAPTVRPDNQVWAEVEFPADIDWQIEANRRAERVRTGARRGEIKAATAHITDQIPHGGHYHYKTNPNMEGQWIIAGAMKVIRLLSDEEVEAINRSGGVSDLPRETPLDLSKYGF